MKEIEEYYHSHPDDTDQLAEAAGFNKEARAFISSISDCPELKQKTLALATSCSPDARLQNLNRRRSHEKKQAR